MKNDWGWSSRACRIKPSKSGNAPRGLSTATPFLAHYLHWWVCDSTSSVRFPWGQTVRVCIFVWFWWIHFAYVIDLRLYSIYCSVRPTVLIAISGVISWKKTKKSTVNRRVRIITAWLIRGNKLDSKTCLTNRLLNLQIWQNLVCRRGNDDAEDAMKYG